MMKKLLVLMLVLCMAQSVCWGALTVSTDKDYSNLETTFTWTFTTTELTEIASVHITGPETGGAVKMIPNGWTSRHSGKTYIWERQSNGIGTFNFSVVFSGRFNKTQAGSVQYDHFVGNNRQMVSLDPPASPSNSNWVMMPVPEPATLCLFGLGGLLLRRRKSV